MHPHQIFLLWKTTGHLAGQPVAPLPSGGSRGCPNRDRCQVQVWVCLSCLQGLCLPLCRTPHQHGVPATTVPSRALLCGRGVGVDLGLWDPVAKSYAAPPRRCELGVADTLSPQSALSPVGRIHESRTGATPNGPCVVGGPDPDSHQTHYWLPSHFGLPASRRPQATRQK